MASSSSMNWPAAARERICPTPGCRRPFTEEGHRHCCSSCRQRRLRGRITICLQSGCWRFADFQHVHCCSICRDSGGSRHSYGCTERQQELHRDQQVAVNNVVPAQAGAAVAMDTATPGANFGIFTGYNSGVMGVTGAAASTGQEHEPASQLVDDVANNGILFVKIPKTENRSAICVGRASFR